MLDRLVPAAMDDMCDLLLTPQARPRRKPGQCWDLVMLGKEIKKDVIQKRFWLKKALLSELRAGRPYSMRDALQVKIGALTQQFLSAR